MKKGLIINILSVFLFFIVWEIIARMNSAMVFFISSPSRIFEKITEMYTSGMIHQHLLSSIYLLFSGVSLSMVLWILFGLLFYRFLPMYTFSKPVLFTLNSLPVLAISPIIILWFWFENSSKIIIMLITALPPIIINTYSWAKNVDKNLIKMAESFSITKSSILFQVVFFSAIPSIYAGLKIMIGRCIIWLVIADMFWYSVGLWYLLNYFGATSDTTGLFTITILLLLINFAFNSLLEAGKYLLCKKYNYHFE